MPMCRDWHSLGGSVIDQPTYVVGLIVKTISPSTTLIDQFSLVINPLRQRRVPIIACVTTPLTAMMIGVSLR